MANNLRPLPDKQTFQEFFDPAKTLHDYEPYMFELMPTRILENLINDARSQKQIQESEALHNQMDSENVETVDRSQSPAPTDGQIKMRRSVFEHSSKNFNAINTTKLDPSPRHDDMEQLKEDNASLKQAVLDLQSQLDHMEKKVDALTQFALYKSRYIPGVDENCVVVIDGAVEDIEADDEARVRYTSKPDVKLYPKTWED